VLRGCLALVSAALLLAGCADENSVGLPASDQETADAAIAAVERSLRNDGFSATVADDGPTGLRFESEECREFDEALPGDDQDLPGETASAESAAFERSEPAPAGGVQETVRAFAGLVEESNDLDAFLELLNDERLGSCLGEAVRIATEAAAAEDQATVAVGDVGIEQLGSEGLGDTGGGVQVTGEITASGSTVPISVAVQVVRVDRALVAIVTTAVGPDEPTADRAALLQVLADGVSDQST
jgi:hypothetical protein